MKPFLRITRNPYEEPHLLNLAVSASNGRLWGEMAIYENTSFLVELADDLQKFPKSANDEVLREFGAEDPEKRVGCYFRLRVFAVNSTGRCAIKLRFNNNEPPPEREVAEFSIQAFPADLDRLSGLLRQFSRLKHRVLEWDPAGGWLGSHDEGRAVHFDRDSNQE